MNKNIVDVVTLFYHIVIKSLRLDLWIIYGIDLIFNMSISYMELRK